MKARKLLLTTWLMIAPLGLAGCDPASLLMSLGSLISTLSGFFQSEEEPVAAPPAGTTDFTNVQDLVNVTPLPLDPLGPRGPDDDGLTPVASALIKEMMKDLHERVEANKGVLDAKIVGEFEKAFADSSEEARRLSLDLVCGEVLRSGKPCNLTGPAPAVAASSSAASSSSGASSTAAGSTADAAPQQPEVPRNPSLPPQLLIGP